ncbi:MAG: hypothetical protein H0V76_12580 [Blastocatellia bacterium]|nr:hypothetical protein [Blastocatellia bacterium]
MNPCPKCNQPNPAEASFCSNCASPLAASGPPPFVGGPPGQQQQYVGQNVSNTPSATGTSQKGIISVALAVAALFCCGPFLGIPAAIVGWMELDAIKGGRSPASNKMLARIGLWGGIAASLLHIVFYFLWLVLGAMSSAMDPYGGYAY